VVWMRQTHVSIVIANLLICQVVFRTGKNYSGWINNMHVSMQALPATTRGLRALFDDAIRRGGRGRVESDERGKASKKEEKRGESRSEGLVKPAVEWRASAACRERVTSIGTRRDFDDAELPSDSAR
jgi:hypothetical protein